DHVGRLPCGGSAREPPVTLLNEAIRRETHLQSLGNPSRCTYEKRAFRRGYAFGVPILGDRSRIVGDSDIPASHMGSRSTTALLRNPTEVRHCSQHAGANVDFGDEGAVDWAFLGNLKQLRAL